jgi:hypothetical protein
VYDQYGLGGGAILNYGHLTVRRSVFCHNVAQSPVRNRVRVMWPSVSEWHDARHTHSPHATAPFSSIHPSTQPWANELVLRNGGGAIHNFGVFKGEDLLFLQNQAIYSGGAILNRNGPLALSRLRFEGNRAQVGVGAVLWDALVGTHARPVPSIHLHA